jgi:putative transposase
MHIVQRGNNRQACFYQQGDYRNYLNILRKAAKRYEARIHAYVLMTNHVHVLITPEQNFSASRMMQYLGRSYVLLFNRIHERTGTLWEGRFRSCLIETEAHLLACYRYIELNPVRAGLVASPDQYRWSSYWSNALGVQSDLLQPRQEWIELGTDRKMRCDRYRRLFGTLTDDEVFSELRVRTR